MNKKALLIVNLGTPCSPNVADVKLFLKQFLNDKHVIGLPWFLRKILVNIIIVPFRAKKSATKYQQLWTNNGSPLLYYLISLKNILQLKLIKQFDVYAAMRYGEPSLKSELQKIDNKNYEQLIILPLFPQYAQSTTGTIINYVIKNINKWQNKPQVQFINSFYRHKAFIHAICLQIELYKPNLFEHILFSFHGVPNSHNNCTYTEPDGNNFSYSQMCYLTASLIVKKLNIGNNNYSVGFQSRMSRSWLSPYTDKLLIQLAQNGVKNVLVVAPSFVADCLETTIEIGHEYKNLFIKNGGTQLIFVKSLNDNIFWADAITEII